MGKALGAASGGYGVYRVIGFLLLGMLAAASWTPEAAATDRPVRYQGFGPRIGVSFEPNQVVFGGHGDFGDLFPRTALVLPVVEVGLGDDITVVSVGADLLFRFRKNFGVWSPYVGPEIAFLFSGSGGVDETDLAMSGVFGIQKGIGGTGRFATELKFAVVDEAPDVKLTAIWTFGDSR